MPSLDKNKFILDATAGFRRMWLNKKHPSCLYIDKRPECEPDQVANFTKLPYPDESFNLIVFDPPHVIQNAPITKSELLSQYGSLHPETWQNTLKKGFNELWRLLKPKGILLFKWANTHANTDKVLALAPTDPLFYQVTKTRPLKVSRNYNLKTMWFCFMKIPKEVEA